MLPVAPSRLHSLFLVAAGALLFVNCAGEGGKARYSLEPVSEESALKMLERASDNPEKTETILERVRTNRRDDFNFQKFWATVQSRELMKRLSPDQQARLLSLQEQSCKDIDFDEFAKLVIGLKRYEYVIGEFRKCQTAVQPRTARDFIIEMTLETMQERKVLAEPAAEAMAKAVTVTPTTEAQKSMPAHEVAVRPMAAHGSPERGIDVVMERSWWESFFGSMRGASRGRAREFQKAAAPSVGASGGAAESATPENPSAGDVSRADKESRVSKFLLAEILKAPEQSWALTICYLNESDYRALDSGLRAKGQQALAENFRSHYQDGCQ